MGRFNYIVTYNATKDVKCNQHHTILVQKSKGFQEN